MSEIFDIETGPESPELLEAARVQLRETPEIRQEGFKQLRELIKENPDLNFPDTEEFMEVMLRCCHWYPESAIKLVNSTFKFDYRILKLGTINQSCAISISVSNCTILSLLFSIIVYNVHSFGSFFVIIFTDFFLVIMIFLLVVAPCR